MIVGFCEGKNWEVKWVFEYLGMLVNWLIRLFYGLFQLMDFVEGDVWEIWGCVLWDQLGDSFVEEVGVDFDVFIVYVLRQEVDKGLGKFR